MIAAGGSLRHFFRNLKIFISSIHKQFNLAIEYVVNLITKILLIQTNYNWSKKDKKLSVK